MIYATLGIAALFLLTINALMARGADKQIAARDQRIADLYTEIMMEERNGEEWRARCERLRADLARQVDRRIALESALDDADKRAALASREAVTARQESNRLAARANRAEAALKAIAKMVSVPPDHPDVGDKIMERLEEERARRR